MNVKTARPRLFNSCGVPGNLGAFHYVTVLTLSADAVDRDVAFTYAVLLHVVAYLPKVVAGARRLGGLVN